MHRGYTPLESLKTTLISLNDALEDHRKVIEYHNKIVLEKTEDDVEIQKKIVMFEKAIKLVMGEK